MRVCSLRAGPASIAAASAPLAWFPRCCASAAAHRQRLLCGGVAVPHRQLPHRVLVPPLAAATGVAAGVCGLRAASSPSNGSTARQAASQRVPKDVQRYWEGVLEGVDKVTAKKLKEFLDLSYVRALRGGGSMLARHCSK